LEDLKRENVAVKDENVAMRERLYHLERQVNQNRRQNAVWQVSLI